MQPDVVYAEAAALGAALWTVEAAKRLTERVPDEAYSIAKHMAISQAIRGVIDRGDRPDLVTVYQALNGRAEVAAIDLEQLVEAVPHSAREDPGQVDAYVTPILEAYYSRKVLAEGARLLNRIRENGDDPTTAITEFLQGIHQAKTAATEQQPTPVGLPVPTLDLDRLVAAAPYFGDFVTAFLPSTDAPTVFLVGGALIAAVGAAGKRAYLRVGTDVLYPNLWLMTIARSSEFRKTSATTLVHHIHRKLPEKFLMKRAGSTEGFVQGFAKANSMGVQLCSEVGSWLKGLEKSYLVGLRELLVEMYDSLPKFEVGRVDKKVAGQSEKVTDSDLIQWPALSILGASTMAWLNANLRESDLQSGFLPRFHFLVAVTRGRDKMLPTDREPPNPEAFRRVVETLKKVEAIASTPPSPEEVQRVSAIFTRRVDGEPPPVADDAFLVGEDGPSGICLRLSMPARQAYKHWARKMDKWRAARQIGDDLAPFYERLENSVLKIGLLCALLRGDQSFIQPVDIQAAAVFGDYFGETIPHMVSREFALTKSAAEKNKVLAIIEAAGPKGILRHEITWKVGMNKKELDPILETLVDEKRVTDKQGDRPGRGAKGTRYFAVAPPETDPKTGKTRSPRATES